MSSAPLAPAASLNHSSATKHVDLDRRVVALDGLRGLMTIFVVVSHYFGEVPSGLPVFMVGWIAVDMFFVLSGYLIGKLILDKSHAANFLTVFYVRRACRTLPIYFLCVPTIFSLVNLINLPWAHAETNFPLWSYLTFSHNLFIAASNAVGHEWLGPTWTMGLEEHFYLVLPLLFLLVPRQWIAAVLCALAFAAMLARAVILVCAPGWWMTTLVFLPTRADVLVCGVVGALALSTLAARGKRFDLPLRIAAPVLLVFTFTLKAFDGGQGHVFDVIGPFTTSLGCTAFLLALVRNAPEAARFRSPILCFFGTTSYAVYLTHMPVLGLMHGLFFSAKPDIATSAQWGVTIAALPVCVALSWLLTQLVEAPISAYGRRWRWDERARAQGNSSAASSIRIREPQALPEHAV
jgi:peptidoglycan/LPS O-acetylase OafA/YrhL